MTDYDEIRTCCSGGAICKRCWAFIAVAVEVLDDTLRSDFGFKHILWVYSGRRGIHAWISDRSACELPDDARRAIVGWLEIVKGSANMAKKVETGADFPGRSLHPSLRRAIDGPLKRAFTETVLVDQDCFRGEDGSKMLLQLLPPKEEAAKTLLRNKWTGKSKSSFEKWTDVMLIAKKNEKVWGPYCEDIVLQYTYPRIDAEVSKHMVSSSSAEGRYPPSRPLTDLLFPALFHRTICSSRHGRAIRGPVASACRWRQARSPRSTRRSTARRSRA